MVAFDNLMDQMPGNRVFRGSSCVPHVSGIFGMLTCGVGSVLTQKAPFGCHVTRARAPSPARHWHHPRCGGYLHMRSVQHPVTPPWSGQRPSACASAHCHAVWMRMYREHLHRSWIGVFVARVLRTHPACTPGTEHEPLGTAKSVPLNVAPDPARFQSSASSCPDLRWTRPGHVKGRYQLAAYAK
jgi:hypothetical protein